MIRSVLVTTLLAACFGCATVETHTVDASSAAPYSGTQRAYLKMKRSTSQFTTAGETWFYAADVPLSVLADTLMLPYDIYLDLQREEEPPCCHRDEASVE